MARQLGAIIASGHRSADLLRIEAATLVIHGTADKVVRPSGGKATANAIPNGPLEVMRHGPRPPRGVWPRIIAGIEATAAQAAPAARATVAS